MEWNRSEMVKEKNLEYNVSKKNLEIVGYSRYQMLIYLSYYV